MLVYEEKDIGFYVGVGQTQSGQFIIIDAHDHQTNEAYLIDADAPESAPRLVAPREHGHEYSVEHHGDRLIITTNSRRRRRLPHLRGAGGRPRHGELARDHPAQARAA